MNVVYVGIYWFQLIKIIFTILLQFKFLQWHISKKMFAVFILYETYFLTRVGMVRHGYIDRSMAS